MFEPDKSTMPSNISINTPMHDKQFAKKLRWLIEQGKHALFMNVTPEKASEMLKRNVDQEYRNRPQTPSVIQRYMTAMLEGRWEVTGEPIIFSSCGRLLNGQHRLDACVRSGRAFETVAVFGIDFDAFKFMDRGKKRSAANVFAIDGVSNYSLMAAATIWLYRILECGGWAQGNNTTLENEQILELYYTHSGLQDSAWVAGKINHEGERLISNALMTALHYLFAQKSRTMADEFMTKVITGVGITKKDEPENAIRKWLMKDNMETGGRTEDTFRAAYVVMAWNAKRQNRVIKMFRWRTQQTPNASFPAIK